MGKPMYGAGVVFNSPRGVLLLKRRERPRHWEFPGGREDIGDPSVWDTARREVKEETGIRLPIKSPDGLHFLCRNKNGFYYTTFIVETCSFRPLISNEHVDYGWFDPSNARQRLELHPGVRRVLQEL